MIHLFLEILASSETRGSTGASLANKFRNEKIVGEDFSVTRVINGEEVIVEGKGILTDRKTVHKENPFLKKNIDKIHDLYENQDIFSMFNQLLEGLKRLRDDFNPDDWKDLNEFIDSMDLATLKSYFPNMKFFSDDIKNLDSSRRLMLEMVSAFDEGRLPILQLSGHRGGEFWRRLIQIVDNDGTTKARIPVSVDPSTAELNYYDLDDIQSNNQRRIFEYFENRLMGYDNEVEFRAHGFQANSNNGDNMFDSLFYWWKARLQILGFGGAGRGIPASRVVDYMRESRRGYATVISEGDSNDVRDLYLDENAVMVTADRVSAALRNVHTNSIKKGISVEEAWSDYSNPPPVFSRDHMDKYRTYIAQDEAARRTDSSGIRQALEDVYRDKGTGDYFTRYVKEMDWISGDPEYEDLLNSFVERVINNINADLKNPNSLTNLELATYTDADYATQDLPVNSTQFGDLVDDVMMNNAYVTLRDYGSVGMLEAAVMHDLITTQYEEIIKGLSDKWINQASYANITLSSGEYATALKFDVSGKTILTSHDMDYIYINGEAYPILVDDFFNLELKELIPAIGENIFDVNDYVKLIMDLIVVNSMKKSIRVFDYLLEYDPASLYGLFVELPFFIQSIAMKGYEMKMIEEASRSLARTFYDNQGNRIYIHELLQKHTDLLQNQLFESFIGSRIEDGIRMQIDKDLHAAYQDIMYESVDNIVNSRILHQNFATNTYGGLLMPYDINLRLASILSGEKNLVNGLVYSMGMGFVNGFRQYSDIPINSRVDMAKILYTGLYGDGYVSNEVRDVSSSIGTLFASIREQYSQTIHERGSLFSIFKGQRLSVHAPPPKLLYIQTGLTLIGSYGIPWLYDTNMQYFGLYV